MIIDHGRNFWGGHRGHVFKKPFWSPAAFTIQKPCYAIFNRDRSSTRSKRKTATQAEARFPELVGADGMAIKEMLFALLDLLVSCIIIKRFKH